MSSEVVFYSESDVVGSLSKVQKAVIVKMVNLIPAGKRGDSESIVADIDKQLAEKQAAMQESLSAGDLDKLGVLLAESKDLEGNKDDAVIMATVKAILDGLPDDVKTKGRGNKAVSKESEVSWAGKCHVTVTSMLKSEWRKKTGLSAAYSPVLIRASALPIPQWSELKEAVKGIPTDAATKNTVTVWAYDGQVFKPLHSLGQQTSASKTMDAYSHDYLGGGANPGNKQSAWAGESNMNVELTFKEWAEKQIAANVPAPKAKK